MNNILKIFCISIFLFTSLSANIDCPPDSSSHLDLRTMLPDGSPNPTQGQIINTGLCACVNFANNIEINRKVLADLAVNNPDGFKAIVEKVK